MGTHFVAAAQNNQVFQARHMIRFCAWCQKNTAARFACTATAKIIGLQHTLANNLQSNVRWHDGIASHGLATTPRAGSKLALTWVIGNIDTMGSSKALQ
jgi:hypothetical protein